MIFLGVKSQACHYSCSSQITPNNNRCYNVVANQPNQCCVCDAAKFRQPTAITGNIARPTYCLVAPNIPYSCTCMSGYFDNSVELCGTCHPSC